MPVTALYAALLTPLFVLLSVRVIAMGWGAGAALGDGGNPDLLRRVWVQGNFAEYVPLALILLSCLVAGHCWDPASLAIADYAYRFERLPRAVPGRRQPVLHIHPNARTTPAVRAEIARSTEPSGTVARRYGISAEAVRKWRKRGAADCLDCSARPHRLPWKASEEERAVVCTLRRATNFALDDLTFVACHVLPHLNRDSVWRILRAEGLNRRPKPTSDRPAKGQGTFRDDDLGFIHVDVKHLPKLQTSDGDRRKRYLFVAIDRRSRSVHLAVKDDETEKSAIAFLRQAAAAFPFRLTHVLTDNGSGSHARLRPCLRRARRGVSPHQAAHAADERHGGALQRTDRRRGAGRYHLLAPRPRAAPARLQRHLQRPEAARAGRQDAQPSHRRTPQSPAQACPRQTRRSRRARRCRPRTTHR